MFNSQGAAAVAFLLVALAGIDAAGQTGVHTDVYLQDQGGTLTTAAFGCPDTGCQSGTIFPQRVFSETLNGNGVEGNPGFRALGGDLPGNLDIDWDFLPLTVDTGPHAGHTSTLLYWDGVGSEAQFGPTATSDYTLTLFGRDNAFAMAGNGDEIVTGETVVKSSPAGAVHDHGSFLLDAEGNPFTFDPPSDSGVYVASLRLRAVGLEDADPVFVVFRTVDAASEPALPIATAWVEARVDTLFVDDVPGIPGDFDGDGDVDDDDFGVFAGAFGGAGPLGDFDLDGDVDDDDFGVFAGNFGTGVASTAIPEPTTAVLVFVAAAAGAASRRR